VTEQSPNDRVERMVTEISLGIPRERSTVFQPEDAATWDRLAAQIAEIGAKGGIVDLGLGHDD
jgi:hypothetical protein